MIYNSCFEASIISINCLPWGVYERSLMTIYVSSSYANRRLRGVIRNRGSFVVVSVVDDDVIVVVVLLSLLLLFLCCGCHCCWSCCVFVTVAVVVVIDVAFAFLWVSDIKKWLFLDGKKLFLLIFASGHHCSIWMLKNFITESTNIPRLFQIRSSLSWQFWRPLTGRQHRKLPNEACYHFSLLSERLCW